MLEQGVLPLDIQMEEVGQQVTWGPEPVLAQEGPPLVPLMEVLNEESGTALVQEDGAMVGNEATLSSLG